jgi:hypothetical protein
LATLALIDRKRADAMELTYHLEIRGRLPRGTQQEMRERFGDFLVRNYANRTVLSGLTVDQAALRSLLGLLWDVGSEVHLVRAVARPGRERRGVEPC